MIASKRSNRYQRSKTCKRIGTFGPELIYLHQNIHFWTSSSLTSNYEWLRNCNIDWKFLIESRKQKETFKEQDLQKWVLPLTSNSWFCIRLEIWANRMHYLKAVINLWHINSNVIFFIQSIKRKYFCLVAKSVKEVLLFLSRAHFLPQY